MRAPAALAALLAALTALSCSHTSSTGGGATKPTVNPPTPPPAPPPVGGDREPGDEYSRLRALSVEDLDKMGLLAEIHFDFDRFDLREGDRRILEKNAEVLKKFDFLVITIGGHCDERGTVEYNLALGDKRARAALDFLASAGVPGARLKTVSYGKESPICRESTEECWGKNRRDHFSVTAKR